MPTNWIVINAQTSRAEHDRLIAVARNAARVEALRVFRRKMFIRGVSVALALGTTLIGIAAIVLAVLAAVGGL